MTRDEDETMNATAKELRCYHPGGDVTLREQVLERISGGAYAEQTQEVEGGTISRQTIGYPSAVALEDARSAGQLRWQRWV